MEVTNQSIARIFREIAVYLEMQNVPFRPRAYEKVAVAIEEMSENLRDIYKKNGMKGLETIPGVGASSAEKIEELLKTGTLKYYEELKKKTPVDLDSLSRIEGLGPKGILKLYNALKIKNVEDLEKALKLKKVRSVEGFGEKSEEKILKSIEFLKISGERFILPYILPSAQKVVEFLKKQKGVQEVTLAGSMRRRKETVHDGDILLVSEKPKPIMDAFVSMPDVRRVLAHGETKSSVTLKNGLDVDLRIVPKESYGAALNYFTGSKDHNVALREIAIKKGLKLNEYGLFRGSRQIAGKSEEEVYKALGMKYIEPEMRENNGEIALAQKNTLPKLISYGALRGDLQVQTNWTDGSADILEMALEAHKEGLEYMVVTDHTKRLAMTGGLDEKKIQAQWKEIDTVNKKLRARSISFFVLKGSECDILKDGSMDLPDTILSKLDVVGASVHSHFNLTRKEQTERVLRAMRNPNVDILFHPTGRVLMKREAYEIDMDEVIKEAKKTGTILEIDAFPDRSDMKDEYIRKCVVAGVKMSIDSDAHALSHFSFLEFGIAQARRGWCTKHDIINAWPREKMLGFLK